MSGIRVLIKDHPHRAIGLATSSHVLIFRHSPSSTDLDTFSSRNASQTSFSSTGASAPRCMVEFSALTSTDLSEYRSLSSMSVHGTLGLITVNNDVFLCVVSASSKVATVRPGETVQRILSVEFHCLNRSDYDHLLNDEINPYPTDTVDDEGYEMGYGSGRREHVLEHPCLTLKKLLSSGTFYYSADFDVTRRLQDRSYDAATVAIDSLEAGFLWNSYMIQPLVDFRSRLSQREKDALDSSQILTSAIRGFVQTLTVPPSSSPARTRASGLPSTITLVSRLSCRRAGTRFNARGIDDDGNVANFVETETIFWTPSGICFSYVQIRGSVPIFWEQATGLLPGQQKISITRSPEATQPAFDKHFENLEASYGAVHVVNLLSHEKPHELDLTRRYRHHVGHSSLSNGNGEKNQQGHELLRSTEYDFHAETRGPGGYEAASAISKYIQNSADAFVYYLSEEIDDNPKFKPSSDGLSRRPVVILQQEGVFRTNCLDCLDRTNLVQTNISRMALEAFLDHRGERGTPDFWVRHGSLWADNGDALSRIYAGTGALKSSFTRHGKMSLAGALADARKSATRMYINNFADKGRQNTIDMLLGRLMGQTAVHLYDPINDFVGSELSRRANEYTSSDTIHIWVGTFNLNGRTDGINEDLSPWLCPAVDLSQKHPEIVAVGFQEIVELSPQQIMSTDPTRRQKWEAAVARTLNEDARSHESEEYVLLRGGQLVGASLSIFVKSSVLKHIKNVEGSLKKTGMSGMAGNKGAVAIRMEFANTSLCFVTAHLAAGFANYEERNRDYKTISHPTHGLRFQRNRSIDDHDAVIWLGDFNYRIGLGDEKVRRFIQMGDLETLYENDQLNLQMVAGLTFPYYSEARITFKPTYKYDVGTDQYDTSDKGRIPAWCDRVLRKGDILRQINYNTAPLRFSDHRPVYATFDCTISAIDEKKKEQLSHETYERRRAVVGNSTANAPMDDTDDEDLIGYDSIEPGLPPASSDRRKWWLDNGFPARSRVEPPDSNHIPNPARPSNPFSSSPTNEWVHVSNIAHPSPSPSSSLRNASTDGTHEPTPPLSRKPTDGPRSLPPPYNPANFPDVLPKPLDDTNDARRSRSPSTASTRSVAGKKPAPPVPRKPVTLGSTSTSSLVNTSAASSSVETRAVPFPPPPRRSGTNLSGRDIGAAGRDVGAGNSNLRKQIPVQGRDKEALPLPRRSAQGLMDDDGALEELRGWEVLKPC
ncbi:hypothetical protein M501DRAFT_993676 [Patellaria atrata CBS 101060]|uniref:phosphoinositide 5-phosphatase n=1 Tax=Patellaria atrata CBS 101060 TaxID=1346257 RepID=A0A9P4SJU8_9PEZI|nr:hypothetical protein M501DRAFT_993676 [Patellaria atrata CBS 101060]